MLLCEKCGLMHSPTTCPVDLKERAEKAEALCEKYHAVLREKGAGEGDIGELLETVDELNAKRASLVKAQISLGRVIGDNMLRGRALRRLLREPYGCPFCDSGKLRRPNNPEKGHDEDCGFAMATQALANTAPYPDPLVPIREVIDFYFEPWGAAKGETWEHMSGDRAFNPESVLEILQERLAELPHG